MNTQDCKLALLKCEFANGSNALGCSFKFTWNITGDHKLKQYSVKAHQHDCMANSCGACEIITSPHSVTDISTVEVFAIGEDDTVVANFPLVPSWEAVSTERWETLVCNKSKSSKFFFAIFINVVIKHFANTSYNSILWLPASPRLKFISIFLLCIYRH